MSRNSNSGNNFTNTNNNLNNSQQNINDFVENMHKLNNIGTQMVGTFTQMATPYLNEFCNNLATSVSTNINTNNSPDSSSNSTSSTTYTTSSENQETFNKKKPEYNIYKTDKTINILVYLPGVDKKDIDVKINNIYLQVYANTNLKTDDNWNHLTNIFYSISLPLDNNYNSNDLFVKYENGALKVLVTKKKEQASKIEIN